MTQLGNKILLVHFNGVNQSTKADPLKFTQNRLQSVSTQLLKLLFELDLLHHQTLVAFFNTYQLLLKVILIFKKSQFDSHGERYIINFIVYEGLTWTEM